MKFNSMLLIIFCLLQALNSSTDGLNEESLIDVTSQILKYAKIYNEQLLNLEDKENLHDLKLYCPPLILDNFEFVFEENGNLLIKFVNLKIVVTGKYNYGIGFTNIVNDFSAALNNFYWAMVFSVSKEELEDGKLDVKFKQIATSAFKYDVFLLTKNALEIKAQNVTYSIEDSLTDLLKKNINLYPLARQLQKVAISILQTIQSDLK